MEERISQVKIGQQRANSRAVVAIASRDTHADKRSQLVPARTTRTVRDSLQALVVTSTSAVRRQATCSRRKLDLPFDMEPRTLQLVKTPFVNW
jgi:hypothetical protein